MITLTKHHGLGNDFLVTTDEIVDGPETARRLCDRRRGIGADGLLLLGRPPIDGAPGVEVESTAALTMVLFNADGSRAEMSGNGIRCLAQAAYRRDGHVDRAVYLVVTDGGVRHVVVTPTDDPTTVWVDVEMGPVTPLNLGLIRCVR
jgi:diaminopimelate epimerase